MTTGDRWRTRWDSYAPRYDRAIRFFERVQFAGAREWVCSQAEGDVLEVAVGTGLNLPFYPDSVRLTGLDFSPVMLGLTRARAAELGREIDLREGDAQALPFDAASFDTVVCTLGLCGFPDERVAIAEMYRVLRPGGRLLLLDHVGSDHRLIHLGQRLVEMLTVRTLGDYQTRRPLPLVEQAGFVIQRQDRRKAGTVERLAAVKPTHDPATISPERAAEIEDIIHRVTRWAATRDDVVGLLLVGSCARNAVRPDSDVDLVLLTADTTEYADIAWAGELALGALIRTQAWGPITEQRFATTTGLEVELGIGPADWASIDPVDPGTRRVVTDGARVLHDPTGILATLLRACRP